MSGTNSTDAGTMTTEAPDTGNTNTSEVTQPTMVPTMDNGSQSTSVTDAVSGTGTSIQVPTKSPGSTTPMKVPVKPGTGTSFCPYICGTNIF